jgi:hypothetical protein
MIRRQLTLQKSRNFEFLPDVQNQRAPLQPHLIQ